MNLGICAYCYRTVAYGDGEESLTDSDTSWHWDCHHQKDNERDMEEFYHLTSCESRFRGTGLI